VLDQLVSDIFSTLDTLSRSWLQRNVNRKSYVADRYESVPMTLTTFDLITVFEAEYLKNSEFYGQETAPNIANGTMFGDLV